MSLPMALRFRRMSAFFSLLALAGCGGGGGGGGGATPQNNGGGVSYTPGVYQPYSSLAAQCARPRTGNDPSGRPWPDRPGSVASENNFLRSWTNELYLWYREVPDLNPLNTANTADYFDLLKTNALTASGQPKDNFHFTFDTNEWIALSQSGVEAGYGAQWFIAASTPPRRIVVAYTEPGSPAVVNNLTRGVEVLTVDGADAINGNTQADVDKLNAGLFPAAPGETHTFTVRELNGAQRTVSMTSASITSTPVQNASTIDTQSGPVGYLLFNDHIATSEAQLANAVTTLRDAGVQDLILDIRYNGGGFLDIASSLAYMIAGTATSGRTFERMTFNDKHPTTNPVTGAPLGPTPFHSTGNFGATDGAALPTLNLPRVYVLTSRSTCSASEAIMNSLRGINITVYQIGSTTCGKPYGFYPRDNCGTTYFSIQFQGVNEVGFGAYSDGFAPNNTTGVAGVRLPGCSVADDFEHALGDASEARLAAALAFRAGNNQPEACPAATGFAPGILSKPGQPLNMADGVMFKSPARENRMLRDM
jgi:carboxyl-terminal processing protease